MAILLLLRSGLITELRPFTIKEQKSQDYLFQAEQSFAVVDALAWLKEVWRTATVEFCYKKEQSMNIIEFSLFKK